MDNQMQTCFKCKKALPLSDFYVHRMMANGHLGKCKDCTKADTKKRTDALLSDPVWVEKEKRRQREKERRLKHLRKPPTSASRSASRSRYKKLYPEKYISKCLSRKLSHAKGFNNHHWSYNPEHAKDVISLTVIQHALVHRCMVYDQERMMYRRLDGTLIDSREAAIAYYSTLKD